MSSTASTSITASPTKGTNTASPSSGIGTTTPTTGMTMTTSNSGGLSPLEQEIFALKAQLSAVSAERNVLQETLRNMQSQTSQDECDSGSYNNQSQSAVYEARLTELHSVIAELKKQLDIRREQIIPEESTDFEDDYELDAEDLLSIDENPHLNSTDKSLRMNFINAKTTKGALSLRSNQNLHRGSNVLHNGHHHNNSNNSTILLTTPSDEEDELESSSGMMDSSPVNNHANDGNNLPSDVDVDGDYFEDDQIITTEGFGLKCVEISNGHHHGSDDVIHTDGLTTWLDGNKTTLTSTTAADSSNCNIESLHNPLNHDYTSSTVHTDVKYDRGSRNVIKHHPDKSIDFSPLSSPESPEDNNEGPLSLMSTNTVQGVKCGGEVSVDEEEEDADEKAAIQLGYHDNDSQLYDSIHDVEAGDDRRVGENGGLLMVDCDGRSSGRKSLQQHHQEQNSVAKQSPQQHRRQVRRHRRNNSNNNRRNRDNNIITQLTPAACIPSYPTTAVAGKVAVGTSQSGGGKALEVQDREHSNNVHLRGSRHHPSTLHAMLSVCKRSEKLKEEFPMGGGLQQRQHVRALSPSGGLGIASMRTTPSESPSPESKPPVQFASLCHEVAQIRQEHAAIKDNLYKKEGELDQTRSALENIAKERDFLKNKVSELEHLLKQSPKRLAHFSPTDLTSIPLDETAPVCKLAERVKLHRQAVSSSPSSTNKQNQYPHNHHHPQNSQSQGKGQSPGSMVHSSSVIPNAHTNRNDCSPSPEVHRKSTSRHSRSHHKHQHNNYNNSNGHNNNHHSKNHHPHLHPPPQPPEHSQHCGLTGADLMLIGQACSTRVVEHLVQPIKSESALREMQHSLSQNGISPLNEEKLREFEIETERLSSKIEHLRSQNDVLTLNLEDAKSQADRLTVLLGKYESNNVALQLAVGYSDHTIEAYDILVALLESELGQLLANLRATGIGANSPSYHQVTDNGFIIPTSTTFRSTSALSSSNLDPTSSCPSSSTANALNQQNQLQCITSTAPIISSCTTSNSSGNNNNSNDNSPTVEPLRTSVVSSSSFNNNVNCTSADHQHPLHESASTTTTTTALILATTTTSTTITATSASTPGFTGQEELDIRVLIERANENRLTAENAARVLLSRFVVDSPGSENNNCTTSTTGSMLILPGSDHHNNHRGSGNHPHHHCPPGQAAVLPQLLPWEETSSCSQTLSSASSLGDTSNASPGSKPGSRQGGELIKNEETRIRDLIITLKTERESVKNTVTELESWSLESLYPSKPPSPCDILEARKLDLETAVLMQELMAMREERAELRAQLFLLEKEKASLELRLESHETQEEAYKARINYLKSEILDYQNSVADPLTQQRLLQLSPDGNANSSAAGANCPGNAAAVNPSDRELVLKKRIQELASALEKVTHNSKMREKQNHEMISELKRANGILIETLEAVKKKYQSRIRKMEEQIMAIMERHSMQLKLHKDRIHYLELENKEHRSQQQQQQQILTSD